MNDIFIVISVALIYCVCLIQAQCFYLYLTRRRFLETPTIPLDINGSPVFSHVLIFTHLPPFLPFIDLPMLNNRLELHETPAHSFNDKLYSVSIHKMDVAFAPKVRYVVMAVAIHKLILVIMDQI